MSGYTLKNLRDVEDQAAKHGLPGLQARFAHGELDAEQTGLSLQTLEPGSPAPFGHSHKSAEEVYVVLAGSGRALLDGETVDLAPMDALRLSPGVVRSIAAGPDGLEFLAFGPRRENDAQMTKVEWPASRH